MSIDPPLASPANRLLAALPMEDYQRLVPDLQLVSLSARKVLFSSGEPVEYVYFPHQAVASIISTTLDGTTTEVGMVGQEGMVGIQVILGGDVLPYQAFIQVEGEGMRIQADRLKAEFDREGTLQKLLLRYVQALFTQVSQTATCNRLHLLEARLARWLLMVRDGIGSDELPLTQEFIAQMLGVRRAGVTEAAGTLQRSGLIRYTRGRVTILNSDGLEKTSCECYRTVKDEFDRLLNRSE